MKPVKFKQVNRVYAKDQPEYQPLPAFIEEDKTFNPHGEVISCWKMSLRERLIVLFTGRVWLSLWCFHKPLTPSRLTVREKEVFNTDVVELHYKTD